MVFISRTSFFCCTSWWRPSLGFVEVDGVRKLGRPQLTGVWKSVAGAFAFLSPLLLLRGDYDFHFPFSKDHCSGVLFCLLFSSSLWIISLIIEKCHMSPLCFIILSVLVLPLVVISVWSFVSSCVYPCKFLFEFLTHHPNGFYYCWLVLICASLPLFKRWSSLWVRVLVWTRS